VARTIHRAGRPRGLVRPPSPPPGDGAAAAERFVRVCPEHGCLITFRPQHNAGLVEVPACPRGHEPPGWLVLDTVKRALVAAAVAHRRAEHCVAVAFDIEQPARHDAHVLVTRAAAPVARA
jgi:hypothetical protein